MENQKNKELNMKRFLLSLIIGILALGLIVCDNNDNGNGNGDDNTHSHSYGEFKYNNTQHWKECSCGDKSELSNHSYSSDWSKNSTQHWKECVCGSKSDVSNHNENPCTVCEYEVIPMFFYGNYIPVEGTHQNPPNLSAAVFNLDELIANRNNARKRCRLATGAPVGEENVIVNQDESFGDRFSNQGVKQTTTTKTALHATDLPRWEEKKSAENAVKANKAIDFTSCAGFMYFISPASFGNVIVKDVANVDVTAQWQKYTETFDGVSYNICRIGSVMITTSMISMSFEFN